MAYSEDYSRRAIEYYQEGHKQAEVQEVYKIQPKTLRAWRTRKENGNLKATYPKTRKARELPPDKLLKYIEKTPDAFLAEIGLHFGCSDVAADKALRKLNITRKKRR